MSDYETAPTKFEFGKKRARAQGRVFKALVEAMPPLGNFQEGLLHELSCLLTNLVVDTLDITPDEPQAIRYAHAVEHAREWGMTEHRTGASEAHAVTRRDDRVDLAAEAKQPDTLSENQCKAMGEQAKADAEWREWEARFGPRPYTGSQDPTPVTQDEWDDVTAENYRLRLLAKTIDDAPADRVDWRKVADGLAEAILRVLRGENGAHRRDLSDALANWDRATEQAKRDARQPTTPHLPPCICGHEARHHTLAPASRGRGDCHECDSCQRYTPWDEQSDQPHKQRNPNQHLKLLARTSVRGLLRELERRAEIAGYADLPIPEPVEVEGKVE